MRRKVEPFLHEVPIVYTLITGITFLAKDNFNDGGGWESEMRLCMSHLTAQGMNMGRLDMDSIFHMAVVMMGL